MVIWLLSTTGAWAVERVHGKTLTHACCTDCHDWLAVFQIGLPGPLGMILTGIAIGNINSGHLVRGLPSSWSKELRAIALAIIFLRSGLELDLRVGQACFCNILQDLLTRENTPRRISTDLPLHVDLYVAQSSSQMTVSLLPFIMQHVSDVCTIVLQPRCSHHCTSQAKPPQAPAKQLLDQAVGSGCRIRMLTGSRKPLSGRPHHSSHTMS